MMVPFDADLRASIKVKYWFASGKDCCLAYCLLEQKPEFP